MKMRENKINIAIFVCVSIVFILVTSMVSILEQGWAYAFITKEFLLAIFSGISGSSFVVLFSEIIKYKLNKKNIENALYENLRELYCQLMKQIKYTEMLLHNPKMAVAENVYSANVPAMNSFINAIKLFEYKPFKTNKFANHLKNFQQSEIFSFEKYLTACMSFLQISILKTKIEKSKQGILNYAPTSTDEKVGEVLKVMKKEAEKRCKSVEELIGSLDKICRHRFSWKKDKAVIDELSFTANAKDIYSFFSDE